MSKHYILDCTLRDGGYINDFDFGYFTVKDIIYKLNNSKVDIVECGFLKSGAFDKDRTLFGSVEFIREFIEPKKANTLYVAMIAYGDSFNSSDKFAQTLTINLFDTTSDVLLHELFHAYQIFCANTGKEFGMATANYEIEAQLAKYYYAFRNKEQIAVEEANKYYYTKGHPWFDVADLSKYILFQKEGKSIYDAKKYAKQFAMVATRYVNSKGDVKYTYTPPSNVEETIENLTILSRKCQ